MSGVLQKWLSKFQTNITVGKGLNICTALCTRVGNNGKSETITAAYMWHDG
jgi:hypothetical protein